MIVFDLRCRSAGHVFEAWFASSEAFDGQRSGGMVQCPVCGCDDVYKAVMAPRLGNRANANEPDFDPAAAKQLLAKVATAQRKLLESSEFVGGRFTDEARAIHLGEADARSIHGSATRAQAESLRAEGIGVSALPLPLIDPGWEN